MFVVNLSWKHFDQQPLNQGINMKPKNLLWKQETNNRFATAEISTPRQTNKHRQTKTDTVSLFIPFAYAYLQNSSIMIRH